MFYDIPPIFLLFWTDIIACGPRYYENKCLSLCKQKSFTTLLSKTMDSTFTSNKHRLFAYCITDGLLDEMRPEQQASIIHIIESLLSEGENAINESLLSGGDASACSKKKNNYFFFETVRPNNSLVVMKARNNKELKETTELNKLNEPNDYMNPKSY